jgi:hypothetical protein
VEEARTNLLVRGEEFQTTWSLSQILAFGSGSIADATTAPNGTLTADRITENSATAQHFIGQIVSGIPASSVITASCYVKFDSANRNFCLQITDAPSGGSGYGQLYLTQSGIVTTDGPTSFTNQSASAENIGNGWYRVRLTLTTAAVTTITVRLFIVSSANAQSYTGDGTSGLFLWGAQLEAGAFPTSYIPTTSSTVTRAAELVNITGTAFSSFYNQTEGSFFCSTFAPKGSVIYGTGDTFDNTQYVTAGLNNNATFRSGGAVSSILAAPVSTSGTTNIAHGYAASNFAAVSNGGTVATGTGGAVPLAQIRLKLGSSAWSDNTDNSINGHIRRLTYWPVRLSNATLRTLTQ